MNVCRLAAANRAAHAVLRTAFWGDTLAEHVADLALYDSRPDFTAFGAFKGETLIGFAEATIRVFPANRPSAHLEGIYVVPGHRRKGVASGLLTAVQAWACANGCAHLGSDAELDNAASQAWHATRGFAETDRLIVYAMPLGTSV